MAAPAASTMLRPDHARSRERGAAVSFVVIVGQGYVGLPLAMRAATVGHRVVGYDTDGVRVERLSNGDSYVEDVSTRELADVTRSGRYAATVDEADCEGFDTAVITVPTPLRDGAPDLSFIEDAGAMLSRHLQPGILRDPGVDDLSGDHRGAAGSDPRAGVGADGGDRLPRGLQPRADRPGQPDVESGQHPQGGVGHRRTPPCQAVQAFYDGLVDETVAVSVAPRKPSWPS